MRKLYRSERDKKIFGLIGGLAEAINVDSTILRVVVVVTTLFSGGVVIPIYILAALVVPREPHVHGMMPPYSYPPGSGSHTHAAPGMNPNPYSYGMNPQQPHQAPPNDLDEMMKDVETKALLKEIEQLKAKLAKYEKGEV